MAQTEAAVRTALATRPRSAQGIALRPLLERSLPLIVGLVALGFNLFALGAPSVWMDEAFSVQLARQPLPVLVGAFTGGGEPNMVLYHLILHGWLRLGALVGLPATETFVRLPSALFAALSSVAVFLLGRRFLGKTMALVGAALYALSGWQLTYAQQTRSYALQLLLVTLSWYALLAALDGKEGMVGRRRWWWWVAYVAATALAVYAHAFSVLIFLAQIVAFGALCLLPGAWRGRIRRALPAMALSVAAIIALSAPLIYVSRHGSKTGWLPAPSLAGLAQHLLGTGGKAKLIVALLIALVLAAVVAAMAVLLHPAGRRLRTRLLAAARARWSAPDIVPGAIPAVVMLLCWAVVPAVVSFFVSQGSVRLFSGRYLVVIAPALFLLVGVGVAALGWSRIRLVLAAVAVLLALALVPSYYAHAQSEDWRTAARWLEAQYHGGDGLVSYNNVQGCEIPLDYYFASDGSAAHFSADAPGVTSLARFASGGDPFAGFSGALDTRALATYAALHPRLFFIAGRFSDGADELRALTTQQWLSAHYRLLGQTSTGIVTIWLYDTSVALAPTGTP
jgi:uncharacterized membrane protein